MGDFDVDAQGYTVVYTDGCGLLNGQVGARAGYGVWFRRGSRYNLSRPVIGRPTSNNAEIQAVTAACNQARSAGIQYLKIYTDSQFVINCVTKWMNNWKRNGWYTKEGQPVINKPELLDMDDAINSLSRVVFVHVRGHQGNIGNEQADRLAKEGGLMYQG